MTKEKTCRGPCRQTCPVLFLVWILQLCRDNPLGMFRKISSQNPNLRNISGKPDEELIKAYKESGDNQYVGILFERYAHLVFGVCMKYLKDEESSKDALMQIFEELHGKLLEFEITKFKSWLHSVSKNHCLMALRKEKSERRQLKNLFVISRDENVESEELFHLLDGDPDHIKTIQLGKAIEQLREEQKTCIELMYLHRKSYREVAEITGYDMKKVKSHIQNGKRNLKLILERR